MSRRIVEEILCVHGNVQAHCPIHGSLNNCDHEIACGGGSRRVLDEGTFLLVEDIEDLRPEAWGVLNSAAAFGDPRGSIPLWKDLRVALRGDALASVDRDGE